MIERRTVIGIAIAFCIVILGIFTVSDKQEQREYAKWAQEMNTVLNESRAADAEIAELSRQKEEWEGEKKEEKAREEKAKETTAARPEKAAVRYTAATTLNVRAEKSTSSRILGTVDKGDSLPDGVQDGDWIRFTYKGKEGFVYATYVIEE